TRWPRDWSSDVCSSDLTVEVVLGTPVPEVPEIEHRVDHARSIAWLDPPDIQAADDEAVRIGHAIADVGQRALSVDEITPENPLKIGRASCRGRVYGREG